VRETTVRTVRRLGDIYVRETTVRTVRRLGDLSVGRPLSELLAY
jgi:hypothetical protein